jgi:glycerophosphoryl diester phosphodiesterase
MKMPITLCLIVIAIAVTLSTVQAQHDVLIIAHRGGRGLWPENTIYGYREALETGVDVLEIDVWRTSDNIVVVNHDQRVDRTTDGLGEVQSFTLAEVQKLDAGYRWSIDGTYPYRGKGHIIPTLDDVLTEYPSARFNIDLKENSDALIRAVSSLIDKHSAHDRVMIASFHQRALRKFRKLNPSVSTSAGSAEIIRFLLLSKLHLTTLFTPQFEAFQVPMTAGPISVVNKAFIDAAHQRGIEVHPWTINDPAEMRRLIAQGIDGIITDFPDRLSEILTEQSSITDALEE